MKACVRPLKSQVAFVTSEMVDCMHHKFLIAICFVLLLMPESFGKDFGVDLDARAYFETAYLSSSGSLTYTEPVLEQYGVLTTHLWDYGTVKLDAWICSALNGQHDDEHRRAFYICEDTLTYGYDVSVMKNVTLTTNGGVLWDFLGGYEKKQEFPIFWYGNQEFCNPCLTPYWNALVRMNGEESKARIRFGFNHPFELAQSITLTPFVEGTWGDSSRFEANYGEEPVNDYIFGGVIMSSTFGFVVKWRLAEHFYIWGRYRQYILVDSQARNIVSHKDAPTAETDFPIFGIGLGCNY